MQIGSISLSAKYLALALVVALTACASKSTPPGAKQSEPAANSSSAPQPTIAPSPPSEANAPSSFQEGTVAEFEKTSSKLSKAAIDYLASISVAIHQAQSVVITGYCDRTDNILGAQELALARANMVRSELIRLGVPAAKMRVKYITVEPKHRVVIALK